MAEYHDKEWGVPLHDDRELFGLIILEGAQAGLSWRTVLHRREAYREAFAGFDPEVVATFTPERLEDIRLNSGVIRNKLKIASAVKNGCGAGVKVRHCVQSLLRAALSLASLI